MPPETLLVEPFVITIGGWCEQNPGADPFGGPVREWCLVQGAEDPTDDEAVWEEMRARLALVERGFVAISQANERLVARARELGVRNPESWRISGISFHDGDLWPDYAKDEHIDWMITEILKLCRTFNVYVQCFTTNLFSHSVFRAGAFTSPYGAMRDAAVVKACRSIKAAIALGAQNIIFWGGREGTEVYEQNAAVAIHRFMANAKLVVDYAFEIGYKGTFTFEPKVYEPRFELFLGTPGSMAGLIQQYFDDPKYAGRVGVNPELPQHVAMLCLSPVLAAAECLATKSMISILHYGGQRKGRMDADFAVGLGGNIFEDFHTFLLLVRHREEWGGVIEIDSRPLRTSTTFEALIRFLEWSVFYLRILEQRVEIYLNDPVIQRIEAAFAASKAQTDDLHGQTEGLRAAMEKIMAAAPPLAEVARLSTDLNELHAYRVLQILLGVHKEGAWLFEGAIPEAA